MPSSGISRLGATAKSITAWLIRLMTGVKPASVQLDPEQQYVFVSNHTSHLDFLVIWASLPAAVRSQTRPVAAKDYWTKGLLKPWIAHSLFSAVLLRRTGRGKKGAHPLNPVFEAIEGGGSIIFFPEGTRSVDGKMGAMKPGIFSLAERFPEVSIIPIALENLTRVLPKSERLPLPLICSAHFLPSIQVKPGEGKEEFLQRLKDTISNSLPEHD